MKKKYIIQIPLILMFLTSVAFLISCGKDDDVNDNKGTQVISFGPSPNFHGGQLKFIGNGLDKVNSIVLPDNVVVTEFISKTKGELIIEIPNETGIDGKVTLTTPERNIETKTGLTILRPIELASFTPASVRPGEVITISGTYMFLVEQITFADNKVVTEFESRSETEIKVVVPEDAQTGFIIMSSNEEEPVLIKSESELVVTAPVATTVAPTTVKAGTDLTINGTNLDLVKEVNFPGGTSVSTFVSQSADKIVVTVPVNSIDGSLVLRPASRIGVETSPITMLAPTIASVAPNPAKNGQNLTITGTDLDLVDTVIFTGDKGGSIKSGRTLTKIVVEIPGDAKSGVVTIRTKANKSVTSESLPFVKPTISSFAPSSIKTNENLTINGSNLDLVKTIKFTGETSVNVESPSENQLIVKVPTNSKTGKFTLVAKNGDEVVSSSDVTILASNVPVISTMPTSAKPGQMITIKGTKLDLMADVIFPDNVKATMFGIKSATTLEVVVPENAKKGTIRITFVTKDGETTESPEIDILGVDPLAFSMYSDAPENGWSAWGGWGGASFDISNTENVLVGSNSIKVNFVGDWAGAAQLGGGSTSLVSYSELALSIFGGPGTEGKKLNVILKGGAPTEIVVTLVEGAWTEFKIPLSDYGNPATAAEFALQDRGFTGVVYVDHIGFR